MKQIFLDVETTGVEDKDRLVQLAYHIKGENWHIDQLFKPPVPMSIDAMSICHITNEMLEEQEPFAGSSHFKELQKHFDDPEAVFIAHNAQFDMKFLVKEGMALPVKHVCTMKIAHFHDAEGNLSKHTLQFLRYTFGLKFDQVINPHDAFSDILVLEALFDYYSQFYTLDEMVAISQKPILLKKMMFGKFKGMWFKDIAKQEMSYLRWMKANMEMDENLRHTVNYYIENI